MAANYVNKTYLYDLIVGVDFGMTYTGVAWSNINNPPQVLNDWDGYNDSGKNKVPTKLVYSRGGAVSAWGFPCEDDNLDVGNVTKCFKVHLDPRILEQARKFHLQDTPDSTEDTKRIITDYLRLIYQHARQSIQGQGQGWQAKRIKFVFTMPTTWTSHSILNDFRSAIHNAGFGSENEAHTATLELTEAEAAAVWTMQDGQVTFQNNDILLVCDAGGGTTDLALFQVSQASIPTTMNQLNSVQGIGIGSTVIDRAFELLVRKRMSDNFEDAAKLLPSDLPNTLANGSTFRGVKKGFGQSSFQRYGFKLEDVSRSVNHAGLGIEDGKMFFSRAEIQELFDVQIDGIIRKVDEQLNWMTACRESDQVKYLLLSGGLGSSAYLNNRLDQRYVQNRHPSARQLLIVKSSDPQMAVVKGLVEHERQKLKMDISLISTRKARASYGVVCKLEYNPQIHHGEDIMEDPYIKGKRWAVRQIDWLIKKGDVIRDGVAKERPFSQKLKPGAATRLWETEIVVSHNEARFLPQSTRQPGAVTLCIVKSNLTEVLESEFEEHRPGSCCWSSRKHFFMANFSIKVHVAPADLKFELWFKGTKYSRGHEPITLEWDKAGAESRPDPPSPDSGYYRPREGWEALGRPRF